MKVMHAYVTEGQYEQLKQESEVAGISISSLVKTMIYRHFQEKGI